MGSQRWRREKLIDIQSLGGEGGGRDCIWGLLDLQSHCSTISWSRAIIPDIYSCSCSCSCSLFTSRPSYTSCFPCSSTHPPPCTSLMLVSSDPSRHLGFFPTKAELQTDPHLAEHRREHSQISTNNALQEFATNAAVSILFVIAVKTGKPAISDCENCHYFALISGKLA